ncbi:MAG: hypothetical protein FWB88_01705 [Defluviitaleaceae bacterium]|nr:hypothetical protein [Defluviitaleaceae bacterium]MCL2239437.1 hypothetical protein [Defluviitaleaceae bacterium]
MNIIVLIMFLAPFIAIFGITIYYMVFIIKNRLKSKNYIKLRKITKSIDTTDYLTPRSIDCPHVCLNILPNFGLDELNIDDEELSYKTWKLKYKKRYENK